MTRTCGLRTSGRTLVHLFALVISLFAFVPGRAQATVWVDDCAGTGTGTAGRSLLQDPDGDLRHQGDRRHDQRPSRDLSRGDPRHREHPDRLDRRPRGDDPRRDREALSHDRTSARSAPSRTARRSISRRPPARPAGSKGIHITNAGGGNDQPAILGEDRRGDPGLRLVADDHAERDRREHDQQPRRTRSITAAGSTSTGPARPRPLVR